MERQTNFGYKRDEVVFLVTNLVLRVLLTRVLDECRGREGGREGGRERRRTVMAGGSSVWTHWLSHYHRPA